MSFAKRASLLLCCAVVFGGQSDPGCIPSMDFAMLFGALNNLNAPAAQQIFGPQTVNPYDQPLVITFPVEGRAGQEGPRGAVGPQGTTGSAGARGAAGAQGSTGPQGLTGAVGSVGPQGLAGADGAIGLTGLTGAIGPIGPQGLTGAIGPVGPQGLTGATGPIGPQGLTGAVGPAGPLGLTGATGPAGPQGPIGPIGPQGLPGLGGVSAHGLLTGLSNDDHPQYVLNGEINSVSTAMIADSAVTATKLSAGAITGSIITDSSITSAKIISLSANKISPQGTGSGLDADMVDGLDASALEESAEIDSDIATHAAIASAHHTRYTDAEAINAVVSMQQGYLLGEVRMWAGPMATVPAGWAVCDGADISRTTYANLFSILGTIYGVGDGSTTFTLPDFRDRTPMGASADSGGAPMTSVSGPLTQAGGSATHTLTITEMPSHDHDIAHTHDVQSSSGIGLTGPNPILGSQGDVTTTGPTPDRSDFTGGGAAHPILDPYFSIVYIIYTGV